MMRHARLISVFLTLFILVLAACDAVSTKSSIVVKGDQIAVVYDQKTGGLDSILSPGTYDIQPLTQRVVFYPVFVQVYTFDDGQTFNDGALGGEAIEALASDETSVTVSLSVVFRVNAAEINVIFDSWGADDYRTGYIRPTARRVVLDVIDDFTADGLTNLSNIELRQMIEIALRDEFEANGFFLERIDLKDIAIAEKS